MSSPNTSPERNQQDEVVAEIMIAAPPERIFQALTDSAQVPKWWGQKGVYRCTKFEADLRIGGKWRSSGIDGQGQNFEVSGSYLEIDPPRLLVSTWMATWTGDVQTTVCWQLTSVAGGTLVKLTHSGLSAHPELAQSYRGWPRMLGWLQALMERDETVEDRTAASWS